MCLPYYDLMLSGTPDTYDEVHRFFINRVRDRLHLCLCMSPVGPALGRRAQQVARHHTYSDGPCL